MNLLIHGLLLTISSSLYAALSKIIIVVYYKYLYHYDNYKDVPYETDNDYSVSAILARTMGTQTPQKYFQNRLTKGVIKYIDE